MLRRLRGERSWREYCWTLTPFLLQYAMETGRGRTMATYVDADLYFFASPVQLLEDLRAGDRHVVLTDHDYVPSRDLRGESGRFCVQFLPVRNSELGGSFVDWWRDLCIDSCSEVATPEVFGDQKYLDRAPGLFGDAVRVESGEGKFLGPWNALRLRRSSSRPIAYHFHGLRSIAGRMVLRSGEWRLGAARRLYREYEQELSKVLRDNTSLRLPRTSLTVRSCAVLLRRGLPIGLLPSGSTS